MAKVRINTGGNFCGHDPECPVLVPIIPAKTGMGGIPAIITDLSEKVGQYYYWPQRHLPLLNLSNGSDRKQRSERRESCIVVLRTLLKYLDLASMRVGVPTPNGFLNLTSSMVARHAGLSLRRTERALRDLKAAGLIAISQPREKKGDSWRGLAAIKRVSIALFSAFNCDAKLAQERKRASARLKKKAENWSREINRKIGLTEITRFATKKIQRSAKKETAPNGVLTKEIQLKALELYLSHGWDKETSYQEASRILSKK